MIGPQETEILNIKLFLFRINYDYDSFLNAHSQYAHLHGLYILIYSYSRFQNFHKLFKVPRFILSVCKIFECICSLKKMTNLFIRLLLTSVVL